MITFLLLIAWTSLFVLFYATPQVIVNNYMKKHNLTWDKLCEYDSLNYIDNAFDGLGLAVFGLIAVNIICIIIFIGTDVAFKDSLSASLIVNIPMLLLFEFILLNQINHGFKFVDGKLNKSQLTGQSHGQSIKV